MEGSAIHQPASAENEIDLPQRIEAQKALVEHVRSAHAVNPSPALKIDLERKTDALRHLENLIKNDPKARAQQAADKAKHTVLAEAFASL